MTMHSELKENRRGVRPLVTAIAMLVIAGLSGCGKVPTWSELTSGKPAETPATPGTSTPIPGQSAVAPSQSHGEGPEQMLAWFKSLQPMQINDQALQRVTSISKGLDSITEINARGGGVTDAGLSTLHKLPALRSLALDGTPVNEQGMKALQRVPSLQSLYLNGSRITGGALGHLAPHAGLTRLELAGCDLTHDDFVGIGKLSALEVLVLNRVRELNDAGLDLVCEARSLKTLQLNECVSLSDKGLVALSKVVGLEELALNKVSIAGVGFGAAISKGGLKSLKSLAVSYAPLTLPGARAINNLKTLESLDISWVPGMNDASMVEFVEGMNHLKFLSIDGAKGVTGQGFAKMKACTNSLETLVAQNTGVVDQGLGFLKGHKKLKLIDLNNTPTTLMGVQQFKRLLPTCELMYVGQRY